MIYDLWHLSGTIVYFRKTFSGKPSLKWQQTRISIREISTWVFPWLLVKTINNFQIRFDSQSTYFRQLLMANHTTKNFKVWEKADVLWVITFGWGGGRTTLQLLKCSLKTIFAPPPQLRGHTLRTALWFSFAPPPLPQQRNHSRETALRSRADLGTPTFPNIARACN